MNKKKFNLFERYAIWKCHEERCGLCGEPMRYKNVTVDHFFPESLLEDDEKRAEIFKEYGISDNDFNINDFENWLPAHANCNQQKSNKIPKFNPGHSLILENLISKSNEARQISNKMSQDKKKDKVFLYLVDALEQEKISFDDLLESIRPFSEKENIQFITNDIILLNGGYWVHRENIAREGFCTCENNHCTGRNEKVYCYFRPDLSPWVIKTGLFSDCYDEIIKCHRCNQHHKRGHIGKINICGKPYKNQILQTD